ncbi:MAG: phosphatidate cytidylyltransferase [Alistipes sp.]|nr:phosphatidate cytidylyltransferase [Alistipes sp.]MBQ8774948.1 phosphatidate cytidylyltransferase [Alistipes sp.]
MSDKLKNFLVRTASGAVMLAVVLGAATGIYTYALLLLLITVVGMWEYYKIAALAGCQPQRIVGMVAGIVLFVSSFFIFDGLSRGVQPDADMAFGGFIYVLLLIGSSFVVEIFKVSETPLRNIASTLLGVMYVALPMSLMLFIPLMLSGGVWYGWYFLFYLFIVWGNDVFAYLVGITLGRHRLCERISPKKSWEGFFGGIAGAMGVGALGAWLLDGSYALWLGLAAVVAISSVFGDLAESMFKREAGIKDSGNFIPGHGGMLDRFDALLLSSFFAFAYLAIMLF